MKEKKQKKAELEDQNPDLIEIITVPKKVATFDDVIAMEDEQHDPDQLQSSKVLEEEAKYTTHMITQTENDQEKNNYYKKKLENINEA